MTKNTAPANRKPDYFKVRTWVIIGPGNAGKSAVIGGLASQSGRGRGGKRDILLRGGGWLLVEARRQSVQEARTLPEDFIRAILQDARSIQSRGTFAYYNLLLALRSDQVHGLPLANQYLSAFVEAGWELMSLVLLDVPGRQVPSYRQFGAPTLDIAGSSQMARIDLQRNALIGRVRNHFGWA